MKEDISLIGIGNPVIDVHIASHTCRLIDEYNLKLDTQNDLPAKTYGKMRQELTRDEYNKTYIPGGCVQNTVRIFQWLLNGKFKTVMYGTVGSDEHARFLAQQLEKENVAVRYSVAADKPTTSAILLSNKHYRTIVYTSEFVDACFSFSQSSPEYLESILETVRHTKIVLLDGFFTLHCPQYIYKLLNEARRHDVLVAFSAGGECVIKANGAEDTYLPFVQRSHIVALNLNEFRAACHLANVDCSDLKLALKSFCQLSNDVVKTELCRYARIIVVTDGENPVHCYTKEDGLIVFPVQSLDANLIKDTTGAGDAFMAGFLYGIYCRKSILESLRIAYRAAVEIIQRVGCQIPDIPPNFIDYQSNQ